MLLAGLILAWAIGRDIARPILRLAGTAKQIQDGELAAQAEVTTEDEIGFLGNAFNAMTSKLRRSFNLCWIIKMARKVRLREEKLKQQVIELKIALDETRQKKKVAEITDTQYSKDLQSEADALRNIMSGKSENTD